MFKQLHRCQSWCICLIQRQNCIIVGVRFERRKDNKKQTNMKTETCKLYSGSFEYFWRSGGDVLVLRGWRLSSKSWNSITSPWMKQLTWLRIIHSVDRGLRLALRTPSGACRKRRLLMADHKVFLNQSFTGACCGHAIYVTMRPDAMTTSGCFVTSN